VSFSWEENHRFTDSIRKGLKERGVLPPEGTRLTVHESLRWTNQQKRDWQRYDPGQVVTFAPSSNRPASSATVVRVEKKKVVVALPSRKEITLDLRRADSFDVARPREIEVAPGDKMLIRANDKRLGLINGQVVTISSIESDGTLQTREGICVPAQFRQWCHGYVVTSHKAQGWTADHVVVAAERLTAKGTYVACSRGRRSCIIHTPDKARLTESLPEGNRRAALDVLAETRTASHAFSTASARGNNSRLTWRGRPPIGCINTGEVRGRLGNRTRARDTPYKPEKFRTAAQPSKPTPL
jgi:hypothetical protein